MQTREPGVIPLTTACGSVVCVFLSGVSPSAQRYWSPFFGLGFLQANVTALPSALACFDTRTGAGTLETSITPPPPATDVLPGVGALSPGTRMAATMPP